MFIDVYFTVKVEGDEVLVFFNCDGSPAIRMSREEALELSCRLEQAAQKIGGCHDGLPSLD